MWCGCATREGISAPPYECAMIDDMGRAFCSTAPCDGGSRRLDKTSKAFALVFV